MNLPHDFIEQIRALLGDETDAFLKSYENPPFCGLRFRNEKVKNVLMEDNRRALLGIQAEVPWAPLSYYYDDEKRPGAHPYHEMGMYYIQEPSAMGPAALLAPNPGERVLDLCAAPGGKTTELSTFLKGEGLLVANEIHPSRAKILASNVERIGITNALVLNEDAARLHEHFAGFFHRILVDAPCSGEGMFRKNPEAINEWSLDNVTMCAARQAEILDHAAEMLMPGGTLVYSTCTFAKEENEDTMDAFLSRHPQFQMITSRRFWPHRENGEGHYMALLQKEGTLPTMEMPSSVAKADRAKVKLLEAFVKDNFTDQYAQAFYNKAEKQGIIAFGDTLYLAPPQCPPLKGLKVMRAGLALGTVKKDRFEPEHAWALAIEPKDALRSVALSDAESVAYLRGETKGGLELTKKDMGWCIASYDNYSMGWGKCSGNQMKNHYPKGLRR